MRGDLDVLFDPSSVALIGASANPAKLSNVALRSLKKGKEVRIEYTEKDGVKFLTGIVLSSEALAVSAKCPEWKVLFMSSFTGVGVQPAEAGRPPAPTRGRVSGPRRRALRPPREKPTGAATA